MLNIRPWNRRTNPGDRIRMKPARTTSPGRQGLVVAFAVGKPAVVQHAGGDIRLPGALEAVGASLVADHGPEIHRQVGA